MTTTQEKDIILVNCPACKDLIYIEQINCGIFRHGIFKHNMEQIPPHSNKEFIDNLIQTNNIIGCGQAFKLSYDIDGKITAIFCSFDE